MNSKPYLLGVDQGTSGSKAVVLDREGVVHGLAARPLERVYPKPDWVEQDPDAVARGVAESISEAIGNAGIEPDEIAGIGLTSQRNTIFPWYKDNGRSVANAITWQDLRTVPMLDELKEWKHGDKIRYRLGYGPGPYLASLHLAWRMRHETAVIDAARNNNLQLGLSTAWLINALGKPSGHKMDTSMVQSMGLYDIRNGDYWDEWLDWVGIGRDPLPEPVPTVHEFGTMCVTAPDGKTADVPVLAMIGDQQSALFGHGDRKPGSAECTHGTGSYVKVFIDNQTPSQEIIDVLCAWDLGERQTYCLEAATTVTGAAIRWLKDNGRIIDSYTELNDLAEAVPNTGGVIAIPAFTGLNMPYNDAQCRAAILGMTLGTDRRHIARAFLESIGFQIRAILDTISKDANVTIDKLLVGGGVSASDLACQIQADLLGIPVLRPTFAETTAWSAGILAGFGAGFWSNYDQLPPLPGTHDTFSPVMETAVRDASYARWEAAVELSRAYGQAVG